MMSKKKPNRTTTKHYDEHGSATHRARGAGRPDARGADGPSTTSSSSTRLRATTSSEPASTPSSDGSSPRRWGPPNPTKRKIVSALRQKNR